MTIRRTAFAAVAAGAFALTACGSDTEAEESVTTPPAGSFDGFDTPRDRETALVTYGCQVMGNYETFYVVNSAYHTLDENEFLANTVWMDQDDRREAASDNLTATLSKYGSEDWHATCMETSDYYRDWIKVGWAEFVDQEQGFDLETAEEADVFDTPQYVLESNR